MAADGVTGEAVSQDRTRLEPVTLGYRLDAEMLHEAMVTIGRAAMAKPETDKPPRRALRAAIIWALLLVSLSAFIDLLKLTGARLEPLWVIAGIVIGLTIYHQYLVSGYKRMARMMTRNPVFEGEIETRLGPDGVEIRSAGAVNRMDWAAVEDVLPLKHGMVLVVPATLAPIPDSALPAGMARAKLKQRIESWRSAASSAGA